MLTGVSLPIVSAAPSPERNLREVLPAQLVSSPTAPKMIDLKHQCMAVTDITHCVIAWLPEAFAEMFFDQRRSKLPAFEEARRQMDQAVVRQ